MKSIVTNGHHPTQAASDTPRIAVIYARVSTTDQADRGYSLPTQIEACQTLARQEGYTVPESHVFVDDYTGTSLNRPQFTKLRDLVRQRLVQVVFVYDLDRLSRKLAHQLLLSDEFEQADVALRIVTMPDSEKTPETQLLANVRGIIAEYERAKILERCWRGWRGRASAEQELASLDAQQRLIEQAELETASLIEYCARVRQDLQHFTLEEKRRALEALNITVTWHPQWPKPKIEGSLPPEIFAIVTDAPD